MLLRFSKKALLLDDLATFLKSLSNLNVTLYVSPGAFRRSSSAMEILLASTPAGISSSSNTTLCGNPALFLNVIFSPALTLKFPGIKARLPSSPPSNTSSAMALLASIALTAVAATTAPTSFKDAFTVNLAAGAAATLADAAVLTLEDEEAPALRPVKDGIATAAEVTVAILLIDMIVVVVAFVIENLESRKGE
ncbi:hypothetical protein H5410_024824 [Solanum commersonii]|uniref:Uncharacterized protein n=1 Tax=Solanum commersonii TaxID=4109 RepID=A0A9J5ZN72_SOLCO|nr:hypothetical protein H5410_024824 [Solanum commersonii]